MPASVLSYLKRYGLVMCAIGYTGTLILLHALGCFPVAGPYDISHLAGSPALVLQGRVISFPQTRWGQTRFLLEGRAHPLEAFHGRVVVNLNFPMEDLAPGEILCVRGWLSPTRGPTARRMFDERRYWAGYRAYAQLRVWSRESMTRVKGRDHASWTQRAWTFHRCFTQFWFDHLPYEEAALISCITMGSRGVLPLEIKNQCIRAGVYHILVVSGQNMALIIAAGVICLRFLRVPRRKAFWICGLPIVFYTLAVGADPPVLRAAAMAIVGLAALAIGRDVPRYVPFVLAWLWILGFEPEALFGASFQLSFGATASLLALLPWFHVLGGIRLRWARWLAEAGAVSLAVHIGVGPLLVYYFHQLSLAGFVANWTLFPWAGGLMIAGLSLGTWGVCSPGTVPSMLMTAMHMALRGTLRAIETMSGWTWAALPLPAPSKWACGIYYALLIGILWVRRNFYRKHVQKTSFL